jgi:hypothetical protein
MAHAAEGVEGAAHRFAVESYGLQLRFRNLSRQPLIHPGGNRTLHRCDRPFHEQLAKGAELGRYPRETQSMPEFQFLSVNPLRDARITSGSTQQGANDGGQHGRTSVASSLAPARIKNLLQHVQQTPRGST